MLIKLPLRLEVKMPGEKIPLYVDRPGASFPVAFVDPETEHVSVEGFFLHDIFHHAAFNLGYTLRDEYLAAWLDFTHPWYTHSFTLKTHPDLMLARQEARDILEWNLFKAKGRALQKRARQELRSLKPSAYKPRIAKALVGLIQAENDARTTDWNLRLEIAVFTEMRSVSVRRVA